MVARVSISASRGDVLGEAPPLEQQQRHNRALPPPAPVNPNLTYTYRTDQELVQASQTASAYCLKYGSQPMTSSMVGNSDGTRTATFQCGSR